MEERHIYYDQEKDEHNVSQSAPCSARNSRKNSLIAKMQPLKKDNLKNQKNKQDENEKELIHDLESYKRYYEFDKKNAIEK